MRQEISDAEIHTGFREIDVDSMAMTAVPSMEAASPSDVLRTARVPGFLSPEQLAHKRLSTNLLLLEDLRIMIRLPSTEAIHLSAELLFMQESSITQRAVVVLSHS